ncbi:nucleotidyl transferase AbiEii/AbiGii toxin family protein [Chitinophaga silvatica]|uniref:Nucleotidyl transferase AbiEii/AbiGii toxin family protein n=1 Tax=Chitinophaga silvatica TaxID=2282649 RepID=A0A3E1YEQ3_9BACT|nr:nucleotidyl transferase AbiEii/AbiGii toxin family protein [Chitinophaga silvatica]RFS24959.1 nucleotidyl transferase AbiEii/AbiGii toxin family protein [Chitinophaga silvatica]
MIEWLNLPEKQKKALINHASFLSGYSPIALEKDCYVTLALQAVFSTTFAKNIIFKGGTSLSKGWQLIKRFSEDVDLAIDPVILGFQSEISKTQIRKLRKASAEFVGDQFLFTLREKLLQIGVSKKVITADVRTTKSSDADPRIIEMEYTSLFSDSNYMRSKVLLELGARSLKEPFSDRPISSLLNIIPNRNFNLPIFPVPTVLPARTMLEKMWLLHEEFSKPSNEIRHIRLSRHMYDLYCLSNSSHAEIARNDELLFNAIRTHRSKFTPNKYVNYLQTSITDLKLIPPPEVREKWMEDYLLMKRSMLDNEAPDFNELIEKLSKFSENLKN